MLWVVIIIVDPSECCQLALLLFWTLIDGFAEEIAKIKKCHICTHVNALVTDSQSCSTQLFFLSNEKKLF